MIHKHQFYKELSECKRFLENDCKSLGVILEFLEISEDYTDDAVNVLNSVSNRIDSLHSMLNDLENRARS